MIEAINFGNKLYNDILNEIKKSSEGKDEITLIQGYLNSKEDKNGKN